MKKRPKISAKQISVTKYANDLDDLDPEGIDDEDNWLAESEGVTDENEAEEVAETTILYLPSNFTHQERQEYGLQAFGKIELELREGQANDALERLRECLAEKSLRFRTEVRLAKGQRKMTRAWGMVHRMDEQIKQAVVTYRIARHAIKELGQAKGLERYKEISKSDLKMSGDVVEENRIGQKSSMLPWFWRLDRKPKENHGEYKKECKSRTFIDKNNLPLMKGFSLQGKLAKGKGKS